MQTPAVCYLNRQLFNLKVLHDIEHSDKFCEYAVKRLFETDKNRFLKVLWTMARSFTINIDSKTIKIKENGYKNE